MDASSNSLSLRFSDRNPQNYKYDDDEYYMRWRVGWERGGGGGSPPVIRWSGLEARWGGRGKVEISQKKMEKRGECRKL